MSGESPFRRPPRVIAQPDVELYPALLDDSQWTQAATFNQDDQFTGPSERIGRYYRQRLDERSTNELEQVRERRTVPTSPLRPVVQRHGWAAGLPQRPLLEPVPQSDEVVEMGSTALGILSRQREAKEATERSMYEGTDRNVHITDPIALHERMSTYVKEGIDESCLAPFNQEWTDNAMEQVRIWGRAWARARWGRIRWGCRGLGCRQDRGDYLVRSDLVPPDPT